MSLYWFVYYKLDTDKYIPLQIFGLNTAQYRQNPASIHSEWIGMYRSVMVCIVRASALVEWALIALSPWKGKLGTLKLYC